MKKAAAYIAITLAVINLLLLIFTPAMKDGLFMSLTKVLLMVLSLICMGISIEYLQSRKNKF